MATISRSKTWVDTDILTAADLNGEFDTVYNEVNGSLSNANISATAAIAGSKLDLSTPGAIGGTTPAAGAFTTLSSSGAATVASLTIGSGVYDKTRHINLTPTGAILSATNGAGLTQTDGTNKSYCTLNFDKDTDEKADWHFVVPDQYDGGNVVFNIWAKTTVTSGNVVWVITTADVADASTYDASLGTTITFDAKTVDGTAGDAFIATKTADPGWTAGRLATIRLVRDVSEDNAAADILFLVMEIKWETA